MSVARGLDTQPLLVAAESSSVSAAKGARRLAEGRTEVKESERRYSRCGGPPVIKPPKERPPPPPVPRDANGKPIKPPPGPEFPLIPGT